MSRAYVFLAEGFEEIEGLTVVDLLRRAGIETEMISIMEKREVTGAHGITVVADSLFDAHSYEEGELLVLPGGMPGTTNLAAHEGLCGLLKKYFAEGKKLAAICAAPSVPGRLGLLKGKDAVCYPGFEAQLEGAHVKRTSVAVDGNVTTSRGMGTAIEFALSLIEQLLGAKKAEEIREGILYCTE